MRQTYTKTPLKLENARGRSSELGVFVDGNYRRGGIGITLIKRALVFSQKQFKTKLKSIQSEFLY